MANKPTGGVGGVATKGTAIVSAEAQPVFQDTTVMLRLTAALVTRLTGGGQDLYTRIVDLLVQFADVPVKPGDRVVVMGPELRERLEQILGMGHILSGEDLLQKVQGLASLKIGGVAVDFSPRQWEELATRAEKSGRTVEEVVADVVKRMAGDFFNYA